MNKIYKCGEWKAFAIVKDGTSTKIEEGKPFTWLTMSYPRAEVEELSAAEYNRVRRATMRDMIARRQAELLPEKPDTRFRVFKQVM